MRKTITRLAILAPVFLASAVAFGWHDAGHQAATSLATAAAGDKMPAFFAKGAETIAHCSLDPDTFTRPIAPPELHNAEESEHYFDLELLEGCEPPATRYEFIALCAARKLDPTKVGLLPYAVTEWTQRLAVALAEHRKWPDNPHIKAKCLVYAGILSHYAEDLCNPLHTTIHYDGRARKDGTSPRTGIHLKTDALLGKVKSSSEELAKDLPVKRFERIFPAVLAELHRSHALVEKVYRLEDDLPALADPIEAGSEVEKFAIERIRRSAAFTASLYVTAWRKSESIKIPDWHKRSPGKQQKPEAPAGDAKKAPSGNKLPSRSEAAMTAASDTPRMKKDPGRT